LRIVAVVWGRFNLFRFVVVTVTLTLAAASLLAEPTGSPYEHTSVLVVKRLHVPPSAIQALAGLQGIERVLTNPKQRMLTIKLKADEVSSPVEIWETAERLKLEPVRLVTARQTYTSKPTTTAKAPRTSKDKAKVPKNKAKTTNAKAKPTVVKAQGQ
jgi:hypothetical protein